MRRELAYASDRAAGESPVAVSGGVTEAVHVLVERRGQGVPVVSLGQRVGTSGQEQTHHLIVP